MTTPFKQALSLCGLKQKDAAMYLDVSLQSIKNWSSGKTDAPKRVWRDLSELYMTINNCADEAFDLIKEKGGKFDELEFNYSGQHVRFPSASCAGTVEAIIRLSLRDN